ncbi:MAG: BrnT family toxin [Deltaproteobacteria bacterium]|jgi:uncharacterized DUF497 family protein|nr:BrnT family toxin [Deltaproteobacteria bacterium]
MSFEWDVDKNRENFAKHGVSFELACKVFDDPLVSYLFDRIVDGEERWQAIGKVLHVPLLVVAHTWRDQDGEEIVRIISARQASSHERRRYEQG